MTGRFDGFTVTAAWCNDGSAELGMSHECGWFLDDADIPGMSAERPVHSHPFEGSASLAALLAAALQHSCDPS